MGSHTTPQIPPFTFVALRTRLYTSDISYRLLDCGVKYFIVSNVSLSLVRLQLARNIQGYFQLTRRHLILFSYDHPKLLLLYKFAYLVGILVFYLIQSADTYAKKCENYV